MYIIAHKLYEAQKRPSRLLIQCRMDHQQCFEHVVIPEGATCGAREVIWRSKPYMELEVILPIAEALLHPCWTKPYVDWVRKMPTNIMTYALSTLCKKRAHLVDIAISWCFFMLCVGFFGVWRWFYARVPVLNADIPAFANLISIYRTPLLLPEVVFSNCCHEVVFSNCCHGVEIGWISSVFWWHPLPPEVFFPLQIGGGLLDTLKYFEVQTQICWKDV